MLAWKTTPGHRPSAGAADGVKPPHGFVGPLVAIYGAVVTTDDELERLIDDLVSSDPDVRDAGAFSEVASMAAGGRLSPDQAQRLGDVAAMRFEHPEIQARAFAPLVLAVLANIGTTRRSWTDAVIQWYPHETDLRGYDPQLGWLHAAAHGADALGELGRARAAKATDLLHTLALRLVNPTKTVFRDQEDDRIAHALALVLTEERLTAEEAVGWLTPITALLATAEHGRGVPANVSNTLRTLRSLSIALEHDVLFDRVSVVVPHAAEVRVAVSVALQPSTAWMWS